MHQSVRDRAFSLVTWGFPVKKEQEEFLCSTIAPLTQLLRVSDRDPKATLQRYVFCEQRKLFKHVRCNPEVAPRLTSGDYAGKVDVISPINILFIRVGKF
jgi:hypothetical protein